MSRVSYDKGGDIYVWYDGDRPVYVGQSANVETRTKSHIREALSQSEFYDWAREKIENGEKPVIKVIAHANSKKELNAIEKQTIEELTASGAMLFNKTWNARALNIGKYVNLVD